MDTPRSPNPDDRKPDPLYENVEVPFTDEELDRIEQEPGGRSLAEILAGLEKQPDTFGPNGGVAGAEGDRSPG